MSRSLPFDLTVSRQRWRHETSTAAVGEASSTAFKLLLLFILMLYSSFAILFKQLDALRPVLLVAVGAITMMVVELAQERRAFRFAWPQGMLFTAFLSVAFISSFDALWPRLGFEKTLEVLKILLIYVVIENTVTSESRLRKVFLTIVIGGLFPAIGTIRGYFIGDFIEGNRARWIGVFANPNEDAYSLGVLVPIALALIIKSGWWMRVILSGVIATYLVAIFLTYSRSGLLGLFGILAIIGWKQKSMAIRAVIVAGLIGSLFAVGMYWNRDEGFKDIQSDTTYNQRIATIKAGMNMFYAHPLMGVGPGCSVVAYPLYVPPEAHCGCQLQLVIHNTPVQALSEVGLLGFIPFAGFIGLSMLHAWKLRKSQLAVYVAALEVALWGFVINGMSGGFVYSWWPYIFIGLIVAARHIVRSQAETNQNATTV